MPQNTFTLIPTAAALVRSPGAAAAAAAAASRPMTSKQVVKAYKASNRQQRVSRAEQLRQERAEIARIKLEQERERKNQDKEKASAKARAVRQKKKDEEAAKREERKRNGLPLVDVRPSQGVLTGLFSRGAKRNSAGEVKRASIEAIPEEPSEDSTDLPGFEQEQEQTREEPIENKTTSPPLDPVQMESEQQPGRKTPDLVPKPPHVQFPERLPWTSEDADEFDLLLESDLVDLDSIPAEALETPPPPRTITQKPMPPVQKAAPPKKPEEPPSPSRKRPLESRYEQDLGLSKRQKPHEAPLPPPSTQYVLCNIDDFFPSLSQQVRELEEFEVYKPEPRPQPEPERKPEPNPQSKLELGLERILEPLAAPKIQKSQEVGPRKAEPERLAKPASKYPAPSMQTSARPHKTEPERAAAKPASQHCSTPVQATCSITPAQPKRFFTDTGSQEKLATAIHKSYCSAELDRWRRKDKMGQEAFEVLHTYEKVDEVLKTLEKENKAPAAPREPQSMEVTASQETDYGGAWLDEACIDFDI